MSSKKPRKPGAPPETGARPAGDAPGPIQSPPARDDRAGAAPTWPSAGAVSGPRPTDTPATSGPAADRPIPASPLASAAKPGDGPAKPVVQDPSNASEVGRPAETAKPAEARPDAARRGEPSTGEAKPPEAKPAVPVTVGTKPVEPKSAEPRPGELAAPKPPGPAPGGPRPGEPVRSPAAVSAAPAAPRPTAIPSSGGKPPGERPAAPPPPPPEPPRRGGFLPGLVGGVVGGGVITALSWALLPADTKLSLAGGAPVLAELQQVQTRLAAVESAEPAAPSSDPALAAVQERLAGLEQRLEQPAAPGAAPGPTSSELAELKTTVDQLQAQLGQNSETAAAAAVASAVAGLNDKIEQLDSRIGTLGSDGQTITGRVDDLDKSTGEAAKQVQALTTRVTDLGTKTDAVATQVTDLSQQVQTAEDRRTRATALALISAEVGDALAQGVPFPDSVKALDALAPQDEVVADAVQQLRPAAEVGGPSLDKLQADFAAAAAKARDALVADEGDWLAHATNQVTQLVRLHRDDTLPDDPSAQAVIERAETAVEAGDIGGGVELIGRLEGPAAAAFETWLADARGRLAAEKAVAQLEAHTRALLEGAS